MPSRHSTSGEIWKTKEEQTERKCYASENVYLCASKMHMNIYMLAHTGNTDHDVLFQHFESWGAIGLKQCMDHLVQLSLLLSRDRIPAGG